MKLIKAHNDSIEGNEVIRQINIERIQKAMDENEEAQVKCLENCDISDLEELEEIFEELQDLLEEVKAGYLEFA